MALASCAGEIAIYDDFTSNTNFHPHVVDLHHGGVNGLSWSSNGNSGLQYQAKVLASCGDDGTIKLFHPPKLEPLREMSNEDHSIIPFNDIEFSPTSQYLAAASADAVVRIWPLQTKQQSNLIKHSWHGNSVNTVTWSHDDQLVVSGCDGGSILLFQRETQTILAPISSESKSSINVLKFSPLKHNLLGEGNRDGDLRVWDIHKQQATVEFPSAHYNSCTSFAFSKVNKMLLVTGGMDATLRFFDIQQKTRIKQLKLSSPVTALDFFSDGFTIAIGDIEGNITLIDLREASNLLSLYKVHNSRVNSVAFTPRKKAAATHGPPKIARNTSSTELNKQNSSHSITTGGGGITASIRAVTNPGSQSNSPKKAGSPKRYSSSGKKSTQNKESSFSSSYRKESADKITMKRKTENFIDQSISVKSESEVESHARNISEVRAQISQRQPLEKQNSFTRQEVKEQNQSSRMFKFETSKANNSFRGSPAIFTKQKAQPFKFSNLTDEISPPPQDGFTKMFLSRNDSQGSLRETRPDIGSRGVKNAQVLGQDYEANRRPPPPFYEVQEEIKVQKNETKKKPIIMSHTEHEFSDSQKKYLEQVINTQLEQVQEKMGDSIKALQIQIVRQFVEHEVSEIKKKAMIKQLFEERQKENESQLKVIEELRQENYELRKRLTKP